MIFLDSVNLSFLWNEYKKAKKTFEKDKIFISCFISPLFSELEKDSSFADYINTVPDSDSPYIKGKTPTTAIASIGSELQKFIAGGSSEKNGNLLFVQELFSSSRFDSQLQAGCKLLLGNLGESRASFINAIKQNAQASFFFLTTAERKDCFEEPNDTTLFFYQLRHSFISLRTPYRQAQAVYEMTKVHYPDSRLRMKILQEIADYSADAAFDLAKWYEIDLRKTQIRLDSLVSQCKTPANRQNVSDLYERIEFNQETPFEDSFFDYDTPEEYCGLILKTWQDEIQNCISANALPEQTVLDMLYCYHRIRIDTVNSIKACLKAPTVPSNIYNMCYEIREHFLSRKMFSNAELAAIRKSCQFRVANLPKNKKEISSISKKSSSQKDELLYFCYRLLFSCISSGALYAGAYTQMERLLTKNLVNYDGTATGKDLDGYNEYLKSGFAPVDAASGKSVSLAELIRFYRYRAALGGDGFANINLLIDLQKKEKSLSDEQKNLLDLYAEQLSKTGFPEAVMAWAEHSKSNELSSSKKEEILSSLKRLENDPLVASNAEKTRLQELIDFYS